MRSRHSILPLEEGEGEVSERGEKGADGHTCTDHQTSLSTTTWIGCVMLLMM